MSTFLALNGLARRRDGLHPLLAALLERQNSVARDPKVVALAARRGDAVLQAGPYPGASASKAAVAVERTRRNAHREGAIDDSAN